MRPIGVKSLIMESNYHTLKRTDNQLLVITHLSQLLTYVTGFGGLLAPLIIWATQKEQVDGMDAHGKSIVNFQLSMLIYSIISIPLIFVVGLGILTLILVAILAFVMPIINAIKASNGELPSYPLSLNFIS
ncbi:DUF4870 domain-containing protein [Winogradskyella damuponensis]|uniref:DUF4870 domain-containing protein n=2 Tax=Winogradskyella damuponensis TaxID=943939 RepID=A0ABP8CW59_9FLAO